jgi:hypothetical protein
MSRPGVLPDTERRIGCDEREPALEGIYFGSDQRVTDTGEFRAEIVKEKVEFAKVNRHPGLVKEPRRFLDGPSGNPSRKQLARKRIYETPRTAANVTKKKLLPKPIQYSRFPDVQQHRDHGFDNFLGRQERPETLAALELAAQESVERESEAIRALSKALDVAKRGQNMRYLHLAFADNGWKEEVILWCCVTKMNSLRFVVPAQGRWVVRFRMPLDHEQASGDQEQRLRDRLQRGLGIDVVRKVQEEALGSCRCILIPAPVNPREEIRLGILRTVVPTFPILMLSHCHAIHRRWTFHTHILRS